MVVLDGNFAVSCGPGTDYPQIHIFQCTLERTDAITKEILEPITFILLAYPTAYTNLGLLIRNEDRTEQRGMQTGAWCLTDK